MNKKYKNMEYKMSKASADFLLKARKGDEKKIPAQQYLCQYVNQVYKPLWPVQRVIVE